jgi:ligand-binding SRPBCC domain-containing protein
MIRIHRLKSVQRIPATLEDTWNFFSDPGNLSVITPPFLHLKVTQALTAAQAFEGQILTYRVRPLLHIPVSWKTEIMHVRAPLIFIDEQREGPYQVWHHQHHFREVEGGVEMTDLVFYRLPFGIIGAMIHPVVKRQLMKIFTYRYHRIAEKFGEWKDQRMQIRID